MLQEIIIERKRKSLEEKRFSLKWGKNCFLFKNFFS